MLTQKFGRPYIVRHQEHTTGSVSEDISLSGFTAEHSVWRKMYEVDKYARDRVMKSARLLLPYISDVGSTTILDVGCYTHEARKYFSRTVTYIGLDEKAYHPKTQVVDLNHGFSSVPCQLALCLETLEHLVDPQDALESIYNSLTDHGMLVVSVPNEATIFHRIRCLCGIVDAGCWASEGKHLHLPNLSQSRKFVSKRFDIVSELYYISPSACNSQSAWIGRILGLFPDAIHQFLADKMPSLFARGFIFLLKKRSATEQNPTSLVSN